MNTDFDNLVTSAVIAKCLHVSSRRVQQLVSDGVITPSKVGNKNKYDLYIVIDQILENERNKAKPNNKKTDDLECMKLQAEVDMKRAKADAAQLELDELKGTMHRAEDVREMVTDLCLSVRSNILSLPGKIAVEIVECTTVPEASEIISREVYDILDDLSKYEYDPEEYKKRVRERQGWMIKDDEYAEENEE